MQSCELQDGTCPYHADSVSGAYIANVLICLPPLFPMVLQCETHRHSHSTAGRQSIRKLISFNKVIELCSSFFFFLSKHLSLYQWSILHNSLVTTTITFGLYTRPGSIQVHVEVTLGCTNTVPVIQRVTFHHEQRHYKHEMTRIDLPPRHRKPHQAGKHLTVRKSLSSLFNSCFNSPLLSLYLSPSFPE